MSMTKLQSVNSCLRGIGLNAVAALDGSDLDASLAEQTVDQVSAELQSRGWWYNKEYNWRIAPDVSTGEIPVPSNVTSVIGTGCSRGASLAIRDGLLYDTWNHTSDLRSLTFTYDGIEVIELVLVLELPFEELPNPVQSYITYVARRQFAMDMEVDTNRWNFQKDDEQKAMIMMQREDAKHKKRNYISNNSAIQNFLGRVGGPNSSTGGLRVFPRRDTY